MSVPAGAWSAVVVAALLAAVSFPLVLRIVRTEDDPVVRRLLPWALAARLLATAPRYAVAFVIYHGNADAATYSTNGAALAAAWRHGHFVGPTRLVPGSGFVDALTGGIYTLTGPSLPAAFLVFAWLAFWGGYACYRAFRIALPDADHVRYARLVFFLPSMLYWPAEVGKDAWMALTVGTTALGAARLFRRRRGGWTLLALGLAGTALVRPHITAILFAAVAIGFVLRPAGVRATPLTPFAKAAGIALLAIAGVVVLHRLTSFLQVDSIDPQQVSSALGDVQTHTSEGGSSFTPVPLSLTSPRTIPRAVLTVLFRPLPWEAHNAQALLAAAESSFLLALAVTSGRRLRSLAAHWRDPYIVVCAVFTLAFVYAFSSFGNFGILARERVQVLPFLVALLCLNRFERRARTWPPYAVATEQTLVTVGRR